LEQPSVDPAITCSIALDLRDPVVGIRARCVAMGRAAVPEAAIDEDRNSMTGEDDIRPDRPTLGQTQRKIDSKAQAAGMKCASERPLGTSIAPAVAPHHG